jgi:MT-A70
MSKLSISPWRRKLGHNPRYSVYDGREQLGSIFESEGVFTAVDADGNLVTIGLGNYVRQQHEHLLIARRGDFPCSQPANRPSSVIEAPRREHSRKPDEVYEIIERMYPELPKIELFARKTRPGWDAWGNEIAQVAADRSAFSLTDTRNPADKAGVTARNPTACDEVKVITPDAGAAVETGVACGKILASCWRTRLTATTPFWSAARISVRLAGISLLRGYALPPVFTHCGGCYGDPLLFS